MVDISSKTSFLFLGLFLGGGTGSMLRWLTVQGIARALNDHPSSVLLAVGACNILGSLAGGAMVAMPANILPDWLRLALLSGLLGGYTTFSTFTVDAVLLANGRSWETLAIYLGLSLVLGFTAAALGYMLVSHGASA